MGLPIEHSDSSEPGLSQVQEGALTAPDSELSRPFYPGTSPDLELDSHTSASRIALFWGLFGSINVLLISGIVHFQGGAGAVEFAPVIALVSSLFGIICSYYCLRELFSQLSEDLRAKHLSVAFVLSFGLCAGVGAVLWGLLVNPEELALFAAAENLVFCALIVATWLFLDRRFDAQLDHTISAALPERGECYTRVACRKDGREQSASPDAVHLSEQVGASKIAVGDILRLSVGAQVPADGSILQGSCQVIERRFGGIASPRFKSPGHELLAGSRVVQGEFEYRVELLPSESRISYFCDAHLKVLAGGEASVQGKFNWYRVFYALTFFIACCSGIYWYEFSRSPVMVLLSMLGVVLTGIAPSIIAHAVRIDLAGLSTLFLRGALCRELQVFEDLGEVQTCVLDVNRDSLSKDMQVAAFELIDDRISKDQLIPVIVNLLGGLDAGFAVAVTRHFCAAVEQPAVHQVSDIVFYDFPGVIGLVDGVEISVGTEEFLVERGVYLQQSEVEQEEWRGQWLYIALGEEVVGRIKFESGLLIEGPGIVSRLRRRGVRTVMCSTVIPQAELDGIGKQVGLELVDIFGGLSSEELLRKVQALPGVVYIGNDATPQTVLDNAAVAALPFDEVHYELHSADVTLLEKRSDLIADIVLHARSWSRIRGFVTYLPCLVFLLLIGPAFLGMLAPATTGFAGLLCWMLLMLNIYRLVPDAEHSDRSLNSSSA